jgi:hypothetical protein
MNRSILRLGLLLSTLVVAGVSHADEKDDKTVCLDATVQGQSLRAAHKLVEAHEAFLVCARPQCPMLLQQACAGWLAEVEKSLPTVVITAHDGAGADIVDVTVNMDGHPLVTKLDGQAMTINPGQHLFQFSARGAQLDQQAVIKEGEKNQSLAVVLGTPSPAAGLIAGVRAGETAAGETPAPSKRLGASRIAGCPLCQRSCRLSRSPDR